jgi:hypothetical protein
VPLIFAFDQYTPHGKIISDKNVLFSNENLSEFGLGVKDDSISQDETKNRCFDISPKNAEVPAKEMSTQDCMGR